MNSNSFSAPILGALFAIGIVASPSGGDNPVFLRALVFILAGLFLTPWATSLLIRKTERNKLGTSFLFLGAALALLGAISGLLSDAPYVVTFFGWFGRADGLFALFGVLGLFLAGSALNANGRRVVLNFFLTGAGVALLVGVAQMLGLNPVRTAGYDGVATTLGNPNFSGAFFGFVAVLAFWMIFVSKPIWLKAAFILFAIGAAVVAWQSLSLQGPAVLAGTLAVTLVLGLLLVEGKYQTASRVVAGFSVLSGLVVVGLTLNGSGPLGFLATEATVTIRKVYWETAVNMTANNPIFGVGPDSFQRYNGANRSDLYIQTVGPDIVVSAAHNVPLHISATLGIPALVFWLLVLVGPLMLLIYFMLLKRIPRDQKFLVLAFASLLSGYLIQSLVSIDHIVLKSTGFLAAGLIVGLLRENMKTKDQEIAKKRSGRVLAKNPSWPAPVAIALLISLVFGSGAHYQSIAPGDFTLDRAKEMLTSKWVPCQIKTRVFSSLDEQKVVDLENMNFLDEILAADNRCYEIVGGAANKALTIGDAQQAVKFAGLLVEIDPRSWRRSLVYADALRLNQDLTGAQAAFVEAKRLADLQPGTRDESLFALFVVALYPTNYYPLG